MRTILDDIKETVDSLYSDMDIEYLARKAKELWK